MSLSQMSSKEKTIVAVLGVVILIALIGIGLLAARLITGDKAEEQAPAITVMPTTAAGEAPTTEPGGAAAAEPGETPGAAAGTTPGTGEGQPAPSQPGGAAPGAGMITPVPAPSLEGLGAVSPPAISDQPVEVVRQEGVGPGSPVIIAAQALFAGHRYRLEISAVDGSSVAIQGSWGQSATSASGKVAAPQIEFFEGMTPYSVDLVAPVPDPVLWGCSVSAGVKDLLGQPPNLAITIWDITGVQ